MDIQDDDILSEAMHWKAANPDPPFGTPYKKPSFEERLCDLGIQDNFEFYMYCFNCQYIPEYWIKYYKSDWVQTKQRNKQPIPLTMYAVMNHLEGKYHISRALPDYINLFAIDLDYRGSRQELITRFRSVIDILPNPVVFQSSKRQGLHLYWFFKSPRYIKNVSLRLRSLLDCKNIIVEKGKYETFPGTCHNLRLPLGRGSFLLDNKTLKPLNLNLHDSIEFIRAYIGNGEILFLTEEYSPMKTKNTKPTFTYDSIQRTNTIVNTEPLSSGIVAEPIIEYGTRNSRQMDLIRRYANEGNSEDNVFELIMRWYRSHPHKSKDWEQNPLRVEKGLRSAIQNWFTKKDDWKSNITGTLTLGEIEFIIDKTMQQKQFVNIGQKKFKLQKFIFNLLLFYKSKQIKNVNLAYKTIIKIPGASPRTEAEFIQTCINIGLIEKTSEHDRLRHKCKGYLLHFTFQDGEGVKTFEGGILQLYSRSELYKMFKRSTYERIIRYKPDAET